MEGEHPLAACIGLPSGERFRAIDWLDEPVIGLPLVTLSACRSAEVAPSLGREVFGLATGLLAGGVCAVVAGLWSVSDRETPPLMWAFYRHRWRHNLATALAMAQRDLLATSAASPIFWAPFVLFGDERALPATGRFWGWLTRRWQKEHRRRYPIQRRPDHPARVPGG
jgi:CHAT domain-containing protein